MSLQWFILKMLNRKFLTCRLGNFRKLIKVSMCQKNLLLPIWRIWNNFFYKNKFKKYHLTFLFVFWKSLRKINLNNLKGLLTNFILFWKTWNIKSHFFKEPFMVKKSYLVHKRSFFSETLEKWSYLYPRPHFGIFEGLKDGKMYRLKNFSQITKNHPKSSVLSIFRRENS